MTIKAIIFDLGDVIIELDFSNFYNQIITLSPLNKPQTPIMMEFFRQSDIYHQGNMSGDEFYELGCNILQVCALDKNEFFDAFNSIISGFNPEMIEVLKKLKSKNKYKLIALSNVNASHWDYLLEKNWGFMEYFDVLILSHEIHLTKPDPKIFQYAIEKAECKPEEILFIDDGLNNIRSAKGLGIIGIHFNGVDDLLQQLKNYRIDIDTKTA
ncbi:MAG: HAD family phosphatase [Promethearchaeota archaeon]|nr:MAG: HAD family phosphatase [Candidatus Lokiarchaeota archaeon]